MTVFGNYLELLRIDTEKTPVIALVGGGGKTSLLFALVDELIARGKRVAVTTTTHMAFEPERPFAPEGDEETVKRNLRCFGYTVAAVLDEGTGKLAGLPEERLGKLSGWCDVLLAEADGSRRHPLKAPEEWEPVIPSIAGMVIGVVGLDCLGKPIRAAAHRPERVSELLQKSLDAPVTAEDVARIASSVRGLRKNVGNRDYRVYLNKADVLSEPGPAREISQKLAEGQILSAWGSLLEAGRKPGKGAPAGAGREEFPWNTP